MSKEQYLTYTEGGRWDDTVQRSQWHFDYESTEPDYREVCTFQGDWDEIVARHQRVAYPNTAMRKNGGGTVCDYHGRKADFCLTEPYAQQDLINHNVDPEIEFYSRSAVGNEPMFTAMADYLGLKDYNIWYQVQNSGQMMHLHIDQMGAKGREAIRSGNHKSLWRFVVMLDDWKMGQTWNIGNTFWRWKRGECISWDWPNIPHGTANFGWWPRPMLQITGSATDRTHELYETGAFSQTVLV